MQRQLVFRFKAALQKQNRAFANGLTALKRSNIFCINGLYLLVKGNKGTVKILPTPDIAFLCRNLWKLTVGKGISIVQGDGGNNFITGEKGQGYFPENIRQILSGHQLFVGKRLCFLLIADTVDSGGASFRKIIIADGI